MRKVLLVEDDIWQAEQSALMISKSGVKVYTAGNALEAIEMFDKYQPDIIVLDILLPGPNGIALLHELKSYDDTCNVPIIVCTTQSTHDLNQLKPYGVRHLLDKTIMQPEDLTRAIRSLVNEH